MQRRGGGDDVRDRGALERAGGGHHVSGLDHARRGGYLEAGAPDMALHLLHFDAGTHRGVEHFDIGLEVVGHALLGREGFGGDALEFQAGEAVVPGRAVGDQRVPALRTPALGDAAALQHDMRHAHQGQVFAHGDAGLASADYQGVDGFY